MRTDAISLNSRRERFEHAEEMHSLVFKVPNREHRRGIGLGDACASGVARQRVAVARPRGEGVEEVVI